MFSLVSITHNKNRQRDLDCIDSSERYESVLCFDSYINYCFSLCLFVCFEGT